MTSPVSQKRVGPKRGTVCTRMVEFLCLFEDPHQPVRYFGPKEVLYVPLWCGSSFEEPRQPETCWPERGTVLYPNHSHLAEYRRQSEILWPKRGTVLCTPITVI